MTQEYQKILEFIKPAQYQKLTFPCYRSKRVIVIIEIWRSLSAPLAGSSEKALAENLF